MTTSPVSLATSHDWLVMNHRERAQISGSWSLIHAIFGPADWLLRGLPPRRTTSSAPSRRVSSTTCRVARVSTP